MLPIAILPRSYSVNGLRHTLRLVGGALLVSVSSLYADETSSSGATNKYPARIYTITRIKGEAPKIDGVLDDSCWGNGEWQGDYHQREPDEGAPASQATELKLLYDDNAIYMAIRAHENQPGQASYRMGLRDEFIGDMVGVAFDSYFDQRTAFEFDVTAGGSKVDLIIHPDGFDTDWNAVWDAKVGSEGDAWVAEFRIPLSQLRYSNNAEKPIWGLHSWRWIDRNHEESNWQVLPMDNSGLVYEFGELHGLEYLKPSRQIEFMPYAVGQLSTYPEELDNPFRDGSDDRYDVGMDAKIGISSNFVVDLTVNPDFGQVEADPSEVNLTTFETFFPEKRPFFLEGQTLFANSFDEDLLFYSRRIGKNPSYVPSLPGYFSVPKRTRILGAAKLTGKTASGLSVGGLYAVAAQESASVYYNGASENITVEPMTQYAVSRLRQDFDDGGTVVGAMLTATVRDLNDDQLSFLPEQSFTGGIDVSRRWLDRTHYLNFQMIGSAIQGPAESIRSLQQNFVHNYQRPDADHLNLDLDATSLHGWGGLVGVGRDNGGNWRYGISLDCKSPGLELNDIGYQSMADQIDQRGFVTWVVNEPGRIFKRYSVGVEQLRHYDFDMTQLQDEFELNTSLNFNNNCYLSGYVKSSGESRDTRVLRGGPSLLIPGLMKAGFYANTDGSKLLYGSLSVDTVQSTDHDSYWWRFAPGASIRIGDHVKFSSNVSFETTKEDFQYAGSTRSAADGDVYMMGRMDRRTLSSTLRLDLNFTPQLSLTYYGNVYVTTGNYSDFKRITDPLAAYYSDRFHRLNLSGVDSGSGLLILNDLESEYQIGDPQFSYRAFNSNLVLRWEYKTGSTLYVVWSQDRHDYDYESRFSPDSELNSLFHAPAENTFLVKASYWFSI